MKTSKSRKPLPPLSVPSRDTSAEIAKQRAASFVQPNPEASADGDLLESWLATTVMHGDDVLAFLFDEWHDERHMDAVDLDRPSGRDNQDDFAGFLVRFPKKRLCALGTEAREALRRIVVREAK